MYLGDENYLGATAYLGEGGATNTPTVTPGYLGVLVGGVMFTSEPWAKRVVRLDGFKGWFDGAPIRSDAPQRPGQHGQFALPAYRDGRSVGMTVWCRADSATEVGQEQRAITGILADGGYGVLAVVEPDGMTTSAVVRLAERPLVETYAWRTVSAQLEFWSPEPFRYGPLRQGYTTLPESVGGLEFDLFTDGSVTTGFLEFGEQGSLGRVTLTNEGNADAWPTFEVRGPASQGFTIQHVESGRRVVSTTYIPAGSSLTVNTANGMASLDGVDRSGQLVVREWSPVPAGGTATYAFTAPEFSAASMVASVWPTYW